MKNNRERLGIEKKKIKNRRILLFVWCLLNAIVFLTVCSKSSFLYPLNDWVDSNCFFTMGKAMMNGKVLYRDIYEQKGPLLYFMHGIAYLISNDSFIGVYFMEIISITFFLFFAAKCANLYLKKEASLFMIVSLLSFMILSSRAFVKGDSVEEFSLVFVMYGLYSVLRAIKSNRLLTNQEAFFNGIGAATILWMKFNLLGFYIGLVVFVLFWYLSVIEIRELFKIIGYFLLGVLLVTFPVIVYCLLTSSFTDMFTGYFYNNLFLYQVDKKESSIRLLVGMLMKLAQENLVFSIPMLAGIFWAFTRHFKEMMVILLTFFTLMVTVFIGGRYYRYYGLIVSPFALFGLIAFFSELERNKEGLLRKQTAFVSIVFTFSIAAFVTYKTSDNVYLMNVSKNEMPQFQFAKEINKEENPKVLNFGFLDGGFYTASNTVPQFKYFCKLNMPYQEMLDGQQSYIENAEADFVVTRDKKLEDYGIKSVAYKKIDEQSLIYDNKMRTYYLYRKNE